MSQNKTVIQGLETADTDYSNQSFSPYSRDGWGSSSHGTVVPGMSDNIGDQNYGDAQHGRGGSQQPQQQRRQQATGKPVVGFLYSVSRTAAGEYWPLHIGQNTIGQKPSCDVILSEGTVSSEHAVIVIRKMKNPDKVIASISDARSTNGTMINDRSLGFAAEECKNGDIITFGDNYECLFILIDPAELGLSVKEGFITTEARPDPNNNIHDGYTRPGDDFSPFDGPTPPHFGNNNATVGFDGSGFNDKGGTVGM